MSDKPLNKIIWQPNTKTTNIMMEQMAKMVATVKTTAWWGKHGSLALVLDKDDYRTVIRDSPATINHILKLAPLNEAITSFSKPFETLTLQELQKVKSLACKLQEAATDIGFERIVEFIEEQYV